MLSILALPEAEREVAAARFCAEHPEHAEGLRCMLSEARAAGQDPAVSPARPSTPATAERLQRLAARAQPAEERYRLEGEVGRGGMGAVLRAWDHDLGRPLAMKVILGKGVEPSGATPSVDADVLQRFLDEAQITGQLDHPGVVPVHELGVDSNGRVYFTMRLVKGQTAEEVFKLAHDGRDGWSITRALEVILKMCDTLAYAHGKGVIHRDLKPSNVMVGRFGEVYVMDWGLAKVLGQADQRDLRIRPENTSAHSRVRTDRSREAESNPDSPLLTVDGAVVGTPCYMPPEQARGEVERLDERSDVYGVGAMLYTLLTGRQPYLEPGQKASPYAILRWVVDGPPVALRKLTREVPGELAAICDKAMARDLDQRYASAAELAEDLRAYLERRVVRAYRTGAWAEAKAWIKRNRRFAIALAVATAALIVWLLELRRSAIRAEEALAAWSLPTLFEMRDKQLPAAPSGIVRYWRRRNASVFGGHVLDIQYSGPKTRIEFVLRNWRGNQIDFEETLFDISYGALPTPTEKHRNEPLTATRQVYILRFERIELGSAVACLRYFDPRLPSDRLGAIRLGFDTRDGVRWSPGGVSLQSDSDYIAVTDDSFIEFVRGSSSKDADGTWVRSEIGVRFHDREDDAGRLNSLAWRAVRTAGVSADDARRAMRSAARAVELNPSWRGVNTLGVAHYRCGEYAEARTTLLRSFEIGAATAHADPDHLAFLAMAEHQLGNHDEARRLLARLEEVMTQRAPNREAQGFLAEARILIGAK